LRSIRAATSTGRTALAALLAIALSRGRMIASTSGTPVIGLSEISSDFPARMSGRGSSAMMRRASPLKALTVSTGNSAL
jgi:hypothetical protein